MRTMLNSYVSPRQGGCLEYNNQEPRTKNALNIEIECGLCLCHGTGTVPVAVWVCLCDTAQSVPLCGAIGFALTLTIGWHLSNTRPCYYIYSNSCLRFLFNLGVYDRLDTSLVLHQCIMAFMRGIFYFSLMMNLIAQNPNIKNHTIAP